MPFEYGQRLHAISQYQHRLRGLVTQHRDTHSVLNRMSGFVVVFDHNKFKANSPKPLKQRLEGKSRPTALSRSGVENRLAKPESEEDTANVTSAFCGIQATDEMWFPPCLPSHSSQHLSEAIVCLKAVKVNAVE